MTGHAGPTTLLKHTSVNRRGRKTATKQGTTQAVGANMPVGVLNALISGKGRYCTIDATATNRLDPTLLTTRNTHQGFDIHADVRITLIYFVCSIPSHVSVTDDGGPVCEDNSLQLDKCRGRWAVDRGGCVLGSGRRPRHQDRNRHL